MNLQNIWRWLKGTRQGKFVLLLIAFLIVLYFVSIRSPARKVKPDNRAIAAKAAEPATKAEGYRLKTNIAEPGAATGPSPTPFARPMPATVNTARPSPTPAPLPMRIYSAVDNTTGVSDEFLPFGRIVPCELVNTVDSSRIATPIIGLVTEDQWQNGNIIIPAGTEVHGKCQLDRSRDRIASERQWVIVWQESGKELPVEGIALDSSPRPDGLGWDITDGSAGLRGMTLKGDNYAEIKEIIARAISAGAAGFVPTVTSIGPLGSVSSTTTGSWQTALAQTVQAAGQVYGNQVLQSIKDDGVYIRVPAGKTFYLYVTQTIDLTKATRGGSRVTPSTITEAQSR
jgi:Bacterial conjugation TrbI-like protein